MSLLTEPFAPFIYFARYFSARPKRERWSGAAQRVCSGLVVVHAGTVAAVSQGSRCNLRPGQAGMTEPGTALELAPDAEGLLVVWEPLWRADRRCDAHGAYQVAEDAAPQPPWESLWRVPLPLPLPESWVDSARRLADEIRREYCRDEMAHAACNLLLGHWLVRLHRAREPDAASPRGTGLAERAEGLIAERFYREGGVAAIAKELLVAPATLSRSYAAHFGYSPSEAIERRRIARAESFLVDSELTIDVIAHKVGYHSQSAFGRAFRRRHGLSPSAWRREWRSRWVSQS